MINECKIGMKKEYKDFFSSFKIINFHNFEISRTSQNYLELFHFPKITQGQPELKVETLNHWEFLHNSKLLPKSFAIIFNFQTFWVLATLAMNEGMKTIIKRFIK